MSTEIGELQATTVTFASHNSGKAAEPVNTFSLGQKKRKDIDGHSMVNVLNGSLEVNGTVKAQAYLQFRYRIMIKGHSPSSSDLRLKTDIMDIVNAIDIVTQLQGKTYRWKKGQPVNGTKGKRVIGLIAQEVQRILPEIVNEDPDTGLLSVSYTEIIPILIEAFKEHLKYYKENKLEVHFEIEKMKERIVALEKGLK